MSEPNIYLYGKVYRKDQWAQNGAWEEIRKKLFD